MSNLNINRRSNSFIGLFGFADGATLKNINLANILISGASQVGGLVGRTVNSEIMNVNVSGVIDGDSRIGGLVG